MDRTFAWFVAGMLLVGLVGCAPDQPVSPPLEDHEPIGVQLLRVVPTLKDERFSTLLDFESHDDAVFCSTSGRAGAVASEHAHTGRASYQIDSSATRLTIKLNSLLAGRQFPGEWTLLGGFFYSEQPATITVGFDPPLAGAKARAVNVPAGNWTAVYIELPPDASDASPMTAASQTPPNLVFNLASPHAKIWCDDLLLIDNNKLLAGESPSTLPNSASNSIWAGTMPPWTVERRGLAYVASAPGLFNFQLVDTDASQTGWVVTDANAMRSMFHSAASNQNTERSLTVYADGRAFENGQYKPMSLAAADPVLLAAHQRPARIEVTEGMGRVDRNTPGDANNDGYNETTGSYRIIATGSRIEMRFIPTGSPILSPILEISGLPFGKPLVTLEGRLVDQTARTSSGTLLIELPAKIDRPVTVDVRIEE
jgi:hypothetical protein